MHAAQLGFRQSLFRAELHAEEVPAAHGLENGRTVSRLREVEDDARVNKLMRMLGTKGDTAAAHDGDIIIAAVDGSFTVKRLEKRGKAVRLLPENPAFAPITLTPGMQEEFFGVVTCVVKAL